MLLANLKCVAYPILCWPKTGLPKSEIPRTASGVRRYKRSPTLGVINELDGRNLLTTLDAPPVTDPEARLVENRDICPSYAVPVGMLP